MVRIGDGKLGDIEGGRQRSEQYSTHFDTAVKVLQTARVLKDHRDNKAHMLCTSHAPASSPASQQDRAGASSLLSATTTQGPVEADKENPGSGYILW
jgi:hypothetical protein